MFLVGICWRRHGVEISLQCQFLLQIHDDSARRGLTTDKGVLEYREIPAKPALRQFLDGPSGFMSPKSPSPSQSADIKQPCKHPRVQVVSRDEESEFVECKECGEIFESSEFKDMNIEESIPESDI